MPVVRLIPTGPGLDDEWGFSGESSWEAISPNSDDATFIVADEIGKTTNIACGSGWAPYYGRILGISIGYRARQTTGVFGDGELLLSVTQGGTPHTIAALKTTLSWGGSVFHFRRQSWSSSDRLTRDDVLDLNVQVESVGIPAGGGIQISQLWLEVEYADTPYVYDPYETFLPDDVGNLGPKAWTSSGGATAIIQSDYLRIDDNDPGDYRMYERINSDIQSYNSAYVTDIETRISMINADTLTNSVVYSIRVWDTVRSV